MKPLWFKSRGKIVVDPPRPGMKKRVHWWIVLNVDPDIAGYYRWWLRTKWWEIESGKRPAFWPPSWSPHVSIVRGEKPRTGFGLANWMKWNNRTIEFWYSPMYLRGTTSGRSDPDNDPNRKFWYIDAEADEFDQIRTDLGLPIQFRNQDGTVRPIRYHITVARDTP